jgi:scyllo-inositol 2-dehydrogenase (NADP+)
MINTALLSFGMSGEIFHAPLLDAHSGFTLKTILERKSDKSKAKYPDVNVTRSADNIAADTDIELVIVNTPNSTHFEFAKTMLEAGKHVVVEKPFTNTFAEAQALIKIANKNNRLLTVFQNRRWDGDFMTMRKVVEEQLLGELVVFEAHYDRYRPHIEKETWKEEEGPGSGLLYNLGSHMIDQAIVLFGAPNSISAEARIIRKGGKVVDKYELFMDYGPMKATIKSSYLVREQGPRYILHGLEGSFVKYGIDPQEQDLKDGKKPGTTGWGVEHENDWGLLNTQIKGFHFRGKIETVPGNYLAFYDNLHRAIRFGKELAVKPEEAAMVIKMIEEAYVVQRDMV